MAAMTAPWVQQQQLINGWIKGPQGINLIASPKATISDAGIVGNHSSVGGVDVGINHSSGSLTSNGQKEESDECDESDGDDDEASEAGSEYLSFPLWKRD